MSVFPASCAQQGRRSRALQCAELGDVAGCDDAEGVGATAEAPLPPIPRLSTSAPGCPWQRMQGSTGRRADGDAPLLHASVSSAAAAAAETTGPSPTEQSVDVGGARGCSSSIAGADPAGARTLVRTGKQRRAAWWPAAPLASRHSRSGLVHGRPGATSAARCPSCSSSASGERAGVDLPGEGTLRDQAED